MAVLIMVAILNRRKSKSREASPPRAQYRWIVEHQEELLRRLELPRLPARSTFFERYKSIHKLYKMAIELQGKQAIREGVAEAESVAVDKSLIAARGPRWHRSDRRAGRVPRGLHGVDRDSTWAFSKHHGWVQGYSYEVVVTAGKGATVFPLLASVGTASVSEHVSFAAKIDHLPRQTKHVLADSGYDNDRFGQRIEWSEHGKRTGRRFLCPRNPRNAPTPTLDDARAADLTIRRRHRLQRLAFYQSRTGRRLYRRRGQSVEPFNEWFKSLFELDQRAWHRGLANNQTQILAAIFCYQLLVRYNHRHRNCNGKIQWILDGL
ncbi:MAG: transposase [Chthoniobacterales bacterium]|nr:transposase [Chthoniobacterales bacterium]